MALTEREYTKWSKDNELCCIGVNKVTVIERDGVVISETLHRHVVNPGDDTTNEVAEVQAIVALLHTPAVVTAYKDKMADQAI
jgi:hypothetical protein